MLGRIVNIPNCRASVYDKCLDTWRHGKGKTNEREPTLGVGVLSMPVSATTNETIQTFSNVYYETGNQHKDTISMREIRSFRITHYLQLPRTR